MDLYDRVGVAALGSRLRRLGEWLSEDAARVFELFGVGIQPRWYPVFQVLAEKGSEAIMVIAQDVGQSHASVSQIAREMAKAGWVRIEKGKEDTRKTYLSLTEEGKAAVPHLQDQIEVVGEAAKKLVEDSPHNLWLALIDAEQAIKRNSLLDRVKREKSERDRKRLRIERFRPEFAADFKRLNEEWITQYFELEASDLRMLGNPQAEIIDKGGEILMALLGTEVVGTCALIPHGEGTLELAKMAVTARCRGLHLGTLLGNAVVERAKEMGAKRLFLESNRTLAPALKLYRNLGFEEIVGGKSPYARADIQMEMSLVD